jgi:hypothetical protein
MIKERVGENEGVEKRERQKVKKCSELTPWNRSQLENLIVAQIFKPPSLIVRFITVLTRAHH